MAQKYIDQGIELSKSKLQISTFWLVLHTKQLLMSIGWVDFLWRVDF